MWSEKIGVGVGEKIGVWSGKNRGGEACGVKK